MPALGNLKELEEMYEDGSAIEPEELDGEYFVVVPWFPWLSLEPLKHRKVVEYGGGGDNVLLDNVRFGRFKLEKQGDSLLIDYDQEENSPVMRGVVDRLRRLSDGRIVGKLYYKVFGREVFLMYFEMRPKRDGE